mmetsp:Transcript_5937/g.14359  ORF Transcript_5937/g.14359 Transcript_5937/m.14359 type:complete len:221 (-) Transcript_5937:740-1402(-)
MQGILIKVITPIGWEPYAAIFDFDRLQRRGHSRNNRERIRIVIHAGLQGEFWPGMLIVRIRRHEVIVTRVLRPRIVIGQMKTKIRSLRGRLRFHQRIDVQTIKVSTNGWNTISMSIESRRVPVWLLSHSLLFVLVLVLTKDLRCFFARGSCCCLHLCLFFTPLLHHFLVLLSFDNFCFHIGSLLGITSVAPDFTEKARYIRVAHIGICFFHLFSTRLGKL